MPFDQSVARDQAEAAGLVKDILAEANALGTVEFYFLLKALEAAKRATTKAGITRALNRFSRECDAYRRSRQQEMVPKK